MRLGAGGGRDDDFELFGEVGTGQGDFEVGVAGVAAGNGGGDELDDGTGGRGVASGGQGAGELGQDAQDGGQAGVGVHRLQGRRVLGRIGVVLVGGVGVGLGVPEGGGVGFAVGEVLEVEAVGGGGVLGAGGVLPPEAGADVDAGQMQGAAQDAGGGGLGDLVGEEVGELVGVQWLTTVSHRASRLWAAPASVVSLARCRPNRRSSSTGSSWGTMSAGT